MWFTRFVLILAGLAMLSSTCQAADDRKLCGSNDVKVDRVIAACRRVVAANPADLPAVVRLGEILREGKQYADCVEVYSKAIDALANANLDQRVWPLFYARGICYERSDHWDKAEADAQ